MSKRPHRYEFSERTKAQGRERCGYRCECCGKKTKQLEYHHKLGVYYAIHYYPHLASKLVKSLENMAVLCGECHKRADKENCRTHQIYAQALLGLAGQQEMFRETLAETG